MNQMEIFKNPEFGSIRVIEENGKYLFSGTDVAAALGYSNPRDAIIRHCRYVVKRDAPHPQSLDRKISMTFIPEGDLYRLIVAPYIDPVFQNNVILTKTESLTMNSRPKDPKTARNKNVLVIGGSGSGKTRFWLKPNLMQMHSSYVVTDPKGTILVECGKMLQRGAPKLGKDGKPMKDKHGKLS